MDSSWKEFDIINDAHAYFKKTVDKIEKKKLQRIVGKKPAQYFVTCSVCKKEEQLSFTGIVYKKKEFICFNCMIK